MARNMVRHVKSRSTKGQATMDKTEAGQCAEIERHLFIDPDDGEFKKTLKTRIEKVGDSDGSGYAS